MPSLTATRAQLVITGFEAATIPYRFAATAAALVVTGAAASLTPGTGDGYSVTTPQLDPLPRQMPIVNPDGTPTQRHQANTQTQNKAIMDAFAALSTQVGDNSAMIAAIQQALALASEANAQAQATAAADALAKSFPNPTNPLSAANTGTITITAHNRVYGDGTSVSVNGGSLSGWTQGQFVQVYYDDAGRAGGAVAYQGTTDVIAQAGARHIVGGVTIPLAGEVPVEGVSPVPPGYVPDYAYYVQE